MTDPKQQVRDLLKSLETGDERAWAPIDPSRYIQHNLAVADGLAGFQALARSRKGTVKVHTVRTFQDGAFVVAHSEYAFSDRTRIGFDIFRFEDGRIVEHWDNLQDAPDAPSPSGHRMTDGPTEVGDLDKTEANKALMLRYMQDLLEGRKETFPSYFNGIQYIQHNPWVGDNLTGLVAGLQELAKQGLAVKYDKVHMVLGEGHFVLVVAEGGFGAKPTAYYDLYRIENGKLAEHWDTLQTIPEPAEWKNHNGKFGSVA